MTPSRDTAPPFRPLVRSDPSKQDAQHHARATILDIGHPIHPTGSRCLALSVPELCLARSVYESSDLTQSHQIKVMSESSIYAFLASGPAGALLREHLDFQWYGPVGSSGIEPTSDPIHNTRRTESDRTIHRVHPSTSSTRRQLHLWLWPLSRVHGTSD